MHVHYLQAEAGRVVSGRLGYQILGEEPKFAEAGESVVWEAGVPHRWWNAGTTELHIHGWCQPPDNFEYYLSAVFASMKENGARPGLFDAAFLTTRYRTEFAILDMPLVVRRLIVPTVYLVGMMIGKYRKFNDAPPPIDRAAPAKRAG